eukprot:796816-Prymnesium_polylepis.1
MAESGAQDGPLALVQSFVVTLATERPLLSAALTLWLAWALANYLRKGAGTTIATPAGATKSREEQMRAARELQQRRLDEAAAAIRAAPGAPQPAAPSVQPTQTVPKAIVKQIPTSDEFDALLSEAASKGQAVVADFTATWCGPCKRIAPLFEELAACLLYTSDAADDM